MNTPKWLTAVLRHQDGQGFGDTKFHVKNHRGKVVKVVAESETRLTTQTTEIAFNDIIKLLNNLSQTGYTGDCSFQVTFDGGEIKKISIKHKVEIYGTH